MEIEFLSSLMDSPHPRKKQEGKRLEEATEWPEKMAQRDGEDEKERRG